MAFSECPDSLVLHAVFHGEGVGAGSQPGLEVGRSDLVLVVVADVHGQLSGVPGLNGRSSGDFDGGSKAAPLVVTHPGRHDVNGLGAGYAGDRRAERVQVGVACLARGFGRGDPVTLNGPLGNGVRARGDEVVTRRRRLRRSGLQHVVAEVLVELCRRQCGVGDERHRCGPSHCSPYRAMTIMLRTPYVPVPDATWYWAVKV